MKYFARAHVPHLPPGEWVEVTKSRFEALQKAVKATNKSNFHKHGVETQVMDDNFSPETYKYVYPELYTLLLKVKEKEEEVTEN